MKPDERKQAGASYIINFYNEVQQLNFFYAQFLNLMLEIKSKYGEELKEMQDDEKKAVQVMAQNVRHEAHIIYIQCQSIKQVREIGDLKEVQTGYEKVKKNFIIKEDDLTEFVVSVNALLIKDVVKDLLVTSQEVINAVYE